MTFFGVDLVNFEMNGNRQLPIWLECDTKNEKIHIYGTPRPEHQGDFAIIVNKNEGVNVCEMHVSVLPRSTKGEAEDAANENGENSESQFINRQDSNAKQIEVS